MRHAIESDHPQTPGTGFRTNGDRRCLNQGWSLIETIVAVSIVVLLAALVFSVTGNIQSRSDRLRCQANLRATGIATITYITDRNGALLPSKHWFSRVSSQGGMRDYLMDPAQAYSGEYNIDTILTCDAIKRIDPGSFPSFMNRGYSLNRFMLAKDPATSYDKNESERPPLPGGPLNLANIPNPSTMWMFMDTGRLYATNIPMNYEPYQLFFPHNEKTNLVFADLHVASMTENELSNPASLREFWGNLNAPY